MNLNIEVNIPFISKEPSLTANISNGCVDSIIREIPATIEQNETRKAKLPKLKFFKSTIWSLILVVPQYVDIATDIILLIDYSSSEMWAYVVLTLIVYFNAFFSFWDCHFR